MHCRDFALSDKVPFICIISWEGKTSQKVLSSVLMSFPCMPVLPGAGSYTGRFKCVDLISAPALISLISPSAAHDVFRTDQEQMISKINVE